MLDQVGQESVEVGLEGDLLERQVRLVLKLKNCDLLALVADHLAAAVGPETLVVNTTDLDVVALSFAFGTELVDASVSVHSTELSHQSRPLEVVV